nr:TonB-dependent receptor [Sphingomonas sp. Y57]
MRKFRRITLRAGLLAATAFGACQAGAQAVGQGSPAAQEEAQSEIVVTAQRREEALSQVPISISVLSNRTLEAGAISSVNDAIRGVAGIAAYESGQAGLSKFSVRGVTSNNSLFNGSSTIGYYLDEIPFAFVRFPVSPDAGSFDISQVEVLRGPQGTLYGANALNGVVRVMTTDADLDDVSVKGRATLSRTRSGGTNYRGDAAINLPIVTDKLAARLVVGYADQSGWLNKRAGGADNVNDSVSKNFRLKLNAAPSERLSLETLVWLSRAERGASNEGTPGNRITTTVLAEPIDTDFDAYGLTIGYEFDGFSVTSATSHIKLDSSSVADRAGDRLLTAIGAKLTSQEVRLVSNGKGPFSWSLGGIYRDARDTQFSDFTLDRIPTFLGVSDNVYTSKSFAAYGEVTAHLLGDALDVTGGLRYFTDKEASNERQALSTGVAPFGVRRDKFDAVTPRAVITYHPDRSSSLYASYSQGFRSGFAQNGEVLRLSAGLASSIKPDRLHNYEIGAKAGLFGGVLTVDLAAYYIDWKDTVQVVTTSVGNPNNPITFNGAVSAPGANGFGADIGLSLQPSKRVRIDGSFSWNNLEFAKDVRSNNVVVFPKGTRLVDSPKYTASASINLNQPVSDDLTAEASASVNYTSKMLTGTILARFPANDITVVRLNAGLRSAAGWTIGVFADNLLDEKGFTRATGLLNGIVNGDHIRPRTIGVQLDFHL